MVVTTAVVGAGAIAFGAGSLLPPTDAIPDSSAALDKASSLSAGDGSAALDSATNTTRIASDTRASRAQRRAGTPLPQTVPEWIKPAEGPLSSPFAMRWGVMHKGDDLAAPYGSIVRAASAGVVQFADWNGGYGKLVIINHGNGLTTRYGHNSAFLVKVGQHVDAGTPISKVGSTGYSTGPHCHFEVRVNDVPIDPLPFMRERGVNLAAQVDTSR
ncbi:MAG: hypothetical protein QOI35_565 [Cryptosporangiaceae bacterium]|jgi:murein DD-endopeptidase MepM/ murein hydrolase activator NlpD|nr:hypothetical protein [Cryptosporangiaceae bacterium]MDQ1651365.1 hypothetical protein [Cryptosporangiaceae bacterium]MDQ1656926.1 hypothetical protein [Cryptosporangiaceae bacterium]